jgi:hypothetical protein
MHAESCSAVHAWIWMPSRAAVSRLLSGPLPADAQTDPIRHSG